MNIILCQLLSGVVLTFHQIVELFLQYIHLCLQTVKESEKPVQKQTMGLAVSTLRGQECCEDDIIRYSKCTGINSNKFLMNVFIAKSPECNDPFAANGHMAVFARA